MKKLIFSSLITVLSVIVYFSINAIDSFRVENYAMGKIQSVTEFENKSLVNIEIDGEYAIVPVYFNDVEKNFFLFSKGDKIIVKDYLDNDTQRNYEFLGRFHIAFFVALLFFFIGQIFVFFGKTVFFPLFALFSSLGFSVLVLIPAVLEGENILLYGVFGSTFIVIFSILFSHGFKRSSFVAAFSALVVLLFAYFLGNISIQLLHLFGYGGGNISYLALEYPNIPLQGIFLISVYLGIVGVIDDVTITQSTAIQELAEANPSYSFSQLYSSGMIIGKAHIFSMINSLVFAYFGSSIAVYITLVSLEYPWWVMINLPFLQEEMIRVLLGSGALILAIPFTSCIAAYFFTKNRPKIL